MPSLDYVLVELDSERRKRNVGKNFQETITKRRRLGQYLDVAPAARGG